MVRFPQIVLLFLCFFLVACNLWVNDDQKTPSKEAPAVQKEEIELQKLRRKRDSLLKTPNQKKKLKTSDTLKPKQA